MRFLGVNTQDETGSAADFLTAMGVTYPPAVDTKGELLSGLGVPGLPITLAIDPTGRIIAKQIGQMSPDIVAALLQQLADSVTPATPRARSHLRAERRAFEVCHRRGNVGPFPTWRYYLMP